MVFNFTLTALVEPPLEQAERVFYFMITTEDAKFICTKKRLIDIEMLQVIEKYIWDKKGVLVEIERPLNLINIQLMNIAFDTACNYYLNEV